MTLKQVLELSISVRTVGTLLQITEERQVRKGMPSSERDDARIIMDKLVKHATSLYSTIWSLK